MLPGFGRRLLHIRAAVDVINGGTGAYFISDRKKERRPHKTAATKDASKSFFDIFDAFFADELTLVFDDVRRVGAEHARRLIL